MDLTKVAQGMRKVLPLKYCGAVIVAAGRPIVTTVTVPP